MSEEKIELEQLNYDLNLIKSELEKLEQQIEIKSYLNLKKDYELLKGKEETLYKKMKYKSYFDCKHLYICTGHTQEFDGNTSKRYFDFGCLKCGLDTSLTRYDDDVLNIDEKINKEFMMMTFVNGFVNVGFSVDFELARAIYNKIVEANPQIDDKKAIKYLEIAIDNMRNIKVSEKRKQSRIRRLNLRSNFNRW